LDPSRTISSSNGEVYMQKSSARVALTLISNAMEFFRDRRSEPAIGPISFHDSSNLPVLYSGIVRVLRVTRLFRVSFRQSGCLLASTPRSHGQRSTPQVIMHVTSVS
jgi:hypothetical protein